MEKGTDLFRTALIKHFIHPTQLDQQNWQHCLSSIRLLLEKEEEDFVEIVLIGPLKVQMPHIILALFSFMPMGGVHPSCI